MFITALIHYHMNAFQLKGDDPRIFSYAHITLTSTQWPSF